MRRFWVVHRDATFQNTPDLPAELPPRQVQDGEEMMADIMDESAEDSSIDAANDTPFPQEEHFEPAFDLAPVNEDPVAPSMDEGSPVSPSISDDRTEQINNSMQSSDLGPMA